jgi:hypothetical protein
MTGKTILIGSELDWGILGPISVAIAAKRQNLV